MSIAERRELTPFGDGMSRRKAPRTILAVLAMLVMSLATLFAMGAASASALAESFIEENINQGYAILNSNTLSAEERSTEFRNYMLTLTDIKRIAVFTLGQYARNGSPMDIDAFVDAYTEYAVAVYEVRLSKYKSQTLTLRGSVDRADDDSVVNAVVSNPLEPSAPTFNVAFRVRSDTNGDPIITDMQVEGVWLAINQRADFTSYLQQHAGNIPDLTANLAQQAIQIRANATSE